jgi:hypothetical protein
MTRAVRSGLKLREIDTGTTSRKRGALEKAKLVQK